MVKANEDHTAYVSIEDYRRLEAVVNGLCEAMRSLAGSVPFEVVRHAINQAVHDNDVRLNAQRGLDAEGKPIE